jgi:hypothetical protein
MNISQMIKWVLQQKFDKMVLVAVEIVLVQVPNLVLMMQVMTLIMLLIHQNKN